MILGVVVVGAIIREINLLIILSGLMFGPLWISWYLVRSTLKQIEMKRDFPTTVFPGEFLLVDVRLKNRKRRLDSWALIYQDKISHANSKREIASRSVRSLVPYLKAKTSESTSYRCQLWERGRYRLGPATLSTKMPVGLLRGDTMFSQTDELLVLPQIGSLTGKWKQLVQADRPGQRSWHRRQGQIEGDFYGLRDWRSGDCHRWIHWRSSAKRNEPVVRQFEQLRTQDFIILLDLCLEEAVDSTAERAQLAIVERAISFAATVVTEHVRQGSGRLTLGVAAQEARVIQGPGNAALVNESLELLAEVRATPKDCLNDLLSRVIGQLNRDDQVVLVSTRKTGFLDPTRIDSDLIGPDQRTRFAQSVCIDTSDSSFSELFEIDVTKELAISDK